MTAPNAVEKLPTQAPATPANPTKPTISNQDFATEVRAERLAVLWRVTLSVAAAIFYVGFMRRDGLAIIMLCAVVIAIGCGLTREWLRRDRFLVAAWIYALSGVSAIALAMATTSNQDALNILPFTFPLIVFIAGLLLSPASTVLLVFICICTMVLVPFLSLSSLVFINAYYFSAMFFSALSALLAAQVTGELYSVTEWALLNYQRERRTSVELFEKRQELERTLLRTKMLSEQLQQANSELAQARDFRGQFLANMSHELRTPLNAIIGFSETMLKFPVMYDNVELPDIYRRDMDQIHVSGQQLLTVINDILDLSKVDAGKLDVHLRPVQIDGLIDNIIKTANGLVGTKPIELQKELPDTLPRIIADETRVRQVLLNLYSNSAKFTTEGYIRLTVTTEGNEVIFAVKDTGSGIAEEQQKVIFEEFRQADENKKGRDPRAGAGLGLAISKRLLDLMNGRIWLESEPGVGSTFYVALPIDAEAEAESEL